MSPAPPPRARRRGRALAALLAPALLASACARPERPGTAGPGPARGETDAGVRPTLEEVFLIPGVHGVPPSARALSADGAWLLFDWRPLEETPEGERALAPRTGPRLISTRDPGASAHQGVPLERVLAAATGEAVAEEAGDGPGSGEAPREGPQLVSAFAPPGLTGAGADLAVASGPRLHLLAPGPSGDPLAWRAELVLELQAPAAEPDAQDEAPPAAGGDAAAREGAGEGGEAAAPRAPTIEALDFDRERGELIVSVDGARLGFALDAARPWRREDGRETRRAFPGGGRPRWSDDGEVAFGADRPLAWLDPQTGALLEAEEDAEPAPPQHAPPAEVPESPAAPVDGEQSGDPEVEPERVEARIWRRADGRYVALEGYQEEARASLSPRGRFVLQTVTDESGSPAPTLVPDYLTERVTTRRARRQWADDVADPSRTWLYDTRSGARAELGFGDQPGWWSTPLGWAPAPEAGSPARHAWIRVAPDFRTLRVFVWSARGEAPLDTPPVQVFELRDPGWVGGPASFPRWTPDGRRLVLGAEATPLSLSPDRSQLFAIDVEARTVRQLTEVAGEVSGFELLDDGRALFTASGDDPRRRTLGLVPAAAVRGEASGARTWARLLPVPAGWNDSPEVSPDGSVVVFEHQTLGHPAELHALELPPPGAADGGPEPAAARRLTRTEPAAYGRIDWIRPLPFEARHPPDENGVSTAVRAHVFLPRTSDLRRPDRPRATVVFIHGAGYLQNVTDSMTRYEVNLLFHSRLAALGYVVIDVDYRGSAGYGNAFRTAVQYDLGRLELEDIGLVVDALAERGVVDPARVACYGGSYGGFLTLMALFTQPERWVAGAALRSVTDWRTYHPRYTQPRLGRPSTHPEAYARSSPIDLAEGLEDPLLILHGMVDSNVFAQDSIRLIERLIDLGKDFDAMLYPSQGHAFEDGMHWLDEYRRIERFLRLHLGPP